MVHDRLDRLLHASVRPASPQLVSNGLVVVDAAGRGLADPQRRRWITEALEEAELDALIAWRPEELVTCTGVAPHLGLSLGLILRDGTGMLYRPVEEPADLIGENLLDRRYQPDRGQGRLSGLAERLARDARDLAWPIRRIGVAGESARVAPAGNAAEGLGLITAEVEELASGVGEVVDARGLFTGLMMRKTEREIDALRETNKAAAAGLQAFHRELLPGRSEAVLAGLVEAAVAAESGRGHVAHARAWAHVQAGPNSAFAGTYSRSSGRIIEAGELAVLEVAVVADGMWCDLTRTAVAGDASPDQVALLAHTRDAQAGAARVAFPGASHEDVDVAARRRLELHGLAAGFSHATGHHVGFRYHDPGPMLAPGFKDPLESGMVIAIEPGTYGPEYGGARFEDNYLITDSGAVPLSDPTLVAQ